jgi:hypothetical protein
MNAFVNRIAGVRVALLLGVDEAGVVVGSRLDSSGKDMFRRIVDLWRPRVLGLSFCRWMARVVGSCKNRHQQANKVHGVVKRNSGC